MSHMLIYFHDGVVSMQPKAYLKPNGQHTTDAANAKFT